MLYVHTYVYMHYIIMLYVHTYVYMYVCSLWLEKLAIIIFGSIDKNFPFKKLMD